MGTPDFAVPILETLIQNTNVVLVVSQPDKKVGRKQILTKTPIHEVADKYGISVFQPEKIRNDYERILEVKPDIIITCAYGQIIPKVLLDLPRLGCINVHASLLPKLRGGAPLHHAIIDGLCIWMKQWIREILLVRLVMILRVVIQQRIFMIL